MSHDSDDIARLRAEMDQAAAGLKEIARNLWTLYSELLAQGFDENQAMSLTHSMFIGMLGGGDD